MPALNGEGNNCNGSAVRSIDPARIQVRSGDNKKKGVANPLAGFSLWYGNIEGQGAGLVEFEGAIQIFATPVGKPIYGFAFNVVPGSTVKNFTGLAFIVNHGVNQMQIVRFTGQNIRLDPPTVLQSTSTMPDFSTGDQSLVLENHPKGGSAYFKASMSVPGLEIWSTTIFSGPGYTAPGRICGFGLIWLGQTTFQGVHSAEVGVTDDNAIGYNIWHSG